MNAILQYLDAIATALEKMSGKTSGTSSAGTAKKTSTTSATGSMSASVNTAAINEKIEGALVVTETEESEEQEGETVETKRSVYDVIREEVATKLHEALFITVEPDAEGGDGEEEEEEGEAEPVEKPVLEAIRDDLYALSPAPEEEEEEEEVING
jgi:hypothetical protein